MVCEFVWMFVKEVGIEIEFLGKGIDEIVIIFVISDEYVILVKVGDIIVWVDFWYFCFVEVEIFLGDLLKVKEKLGWVFEIIVEEMCVEMVVGDL